MIFEKGILFRIWILEENRNPEGGLISVALGATQGNGRRGFFIFFIKIFHFTVTF